jgi:hypothetical protein
MGGRKVEYGFCKIVSASDCSSAATMRRDRLYHNQLICLNLQIVLGLIFLNIGQELIEIGDVDD